MSLLIDNNNTFVCYPKNKNYATWFEIFFNQDNYKEKLQVIGEQNLELVSIFITLNVENSLSIDDVIFLRLIRSETIIPSPAAFNSLDL